MKEFASVFVFAIIIEALVEVVKWIFPRWYPQYVSVPISIFLCIGYQIDILGMLGFTSSIPIVGFAVTGLVCSRGSNFLHDVLEKVGGARVESEIKKETKIVEVKKVTPETVNPYRKTNG